jgi:hypothetical protein
MHSLPILAKRSRGLTGAGGEESELEPEWDIGLV